MKNEIKIHCSYDELLPIKSVKPNPKNRNKHSNDQIDRLVKLIEYQGIRHPLIISKNTGLLVVGHERLSSFKKLGIKEVPVKYQEFKDQDQETAFAISDNAISEWSELDLSGINEDLADLGPDFDIDFLGIKNFTIDVADKELGDEEDTPEPPKEPKVVLGEVYVLGDHRLCCGDSTSIDDVEKLMAGKKADMVFTDPPYNQETDGGFNGSIGKALRKQSSEIEHLCNFEPDEFLNILPLVFEKGKLNALIFCNKDLVVDYLKWAKDSCFSYNILFWKKPSAIPIGGSYRPDVEYLLSFRKSAIFNSGLKDVEYSKCLEFGREKDKVHPTMKPVDMITNQLKICSNEKSVIMDFFGGSGSTLIAAEKTNRHARLMELDPIYCAVILDRWQKFTGRKAIRESDNKLWDEIKEGK